MKKRLTIFLLIVLTISLCACSPANSEPLEVPYIDIHYETVVVGGGSNSNSPIRLSGQSIWDNSSWQNEKALPEMTVSLFGETYIGKYQESTIDFMDIFCC